MSQKVSLNRIIGNVAGNLGLDNVNESLEDFARWSAEAVWKIGSKNSFHRHECEIEIKNFKANLPPNFAYPLGFKFKNKHLSVTKRTFRDFSKGRSVSDPLPGQSTSSGQKITNVPGVPLLIRILFSGVFTTSEVINITVVSTDCGNVVPNTFTYIVQPADTPATIAAAFNAQFNAIANLPYTSNLNGDAIDLTGKTPDINFTITIQENSVMGNVEQTIVQKRVPSKQNTDISSGSKKTPQFTSPNLANRDVTKLNTGISATNRGNGGYYGFNYDGSASEEVVAIDNGCINFNTLDGEKIGVAYMGIDLDDEGWPLIYWMHEDAVTHYIQFMFISRRYYNAKVPQHVFKEAKQRWEDLCGQARGDDELPDGMELEYLANMWNQLVPLRNKNFF
jgi:hypothetical protein